MKNMSWPVIWLVAAVVLVAGYFVGQARLHSGHTATAPVTSVSAQL
jgi:hypothetical protein